MASPLIAFFGNDIELLDTVMIKGTQTKLLDDLERGCSCLALDIAAAGYYFQKGIPFRMPCGIVPDQEIEAFQTKPCQTFRKLSAIEFPSDMWAANWLEQDYIVLGMSLPGALHAEAIGKWVLEQGIKTFFFAQADSLRPFSPDFSHNDIASSIWRTMLPGIARPIFMSLSPPERNFPPSDYSLLKDRICFFMHEFEHFRMMPFVNHTAAKRDVAVVLNNVSYGISMPCKTRAFPTLFQLPCKPVPVPEDFAASFVTRWNSLLPPGLEWLARHLLTERWSGLEATYRHWLDIMRQNPPALCVVSNNLLPHCDIPILAARQCNIPVVSVAHAAVNDRLPGLQGSLDTDAMVFAMPLMAEIQKECTPHIPSYSVRQLRHEQEYSTPIPDDSPRKKNHVLFINTVLEPAHILAYSSLPNSFISELAEFQRLFLERPSFSLSYKQHPGKPEFPLLTMAGIPEEQWLAATSNLRSALRGTGVVVSYNYRGAPLVIAMQCGIPVIVLDTNPPLQSGKRFFSYGWYQKKLRGDVEITTAADAWKSIDRLFADDVWRGELLARQREFVRQSFGLGKTDWFTLMEKLQADSRCRSAHHRRWCRNR